MPLPKGKIQRRRMASPYVDRHEALDPGMVVLKGGMEAVLLVTCLEVAPEAWISRLVEADLRPQ